MQPGIRQLAAQLAAGTVTAEALTAQAVAAAHAADRVFIRVDDDAVEQARALDRQRSGGQLPPLAGVPLSLKDLFDVRGQQTVAGSKALAAEMPVAAQDAEVVGHLRAAGLVLVGRCNMSEFAFSGMGMNPHYGTPNSIWDRATGRLPGGSSSGSAVSVAEGIVAATVGSDTAGSCRVPAAFNGIVGVKPSFGRLSLQGAYPLSPTSDAPGPLAVDVESCFLLDWVMSGRRLELPLPTLDPTPAEALRLVLPDAVVMASLDAPVAQTFARAMQQLRAAGVEIIERPMPVIDDCVEMLCTQAVVLYEVWQAHLPRRDRWPEYDPFVRQRMRGGESVTWQQQQARYAHKAELKRRFEQNMGDWGATAVVYPTTAGLPPPMPPPDCSMDALNAINLRCLRNTASANYFDGCSISLPCHDRGAPPVGCMLSAVHGADAALYRVAAAVERIFHDAAG